MRRDRGEMSKLKPCPFCGGEATFHTYGRTCNVVCDDCLIGTRLEHIDEYEVAIDAWNTRAERTCRMELVDIIGGIRHVRRCEECEAELSNDLSAIEGAWLPNYCPNCGARVVE